MQELCTPRPLRLPLGFALGQPLRPRGAKSLPSGNIVILRSPHHLKPMNPQQPKTQIINHTTPHPLLPNGSPFENPFQNLGPQKVPIFFKVPIFLISPLRTHKKSMQPLSKVNNLITCVNTTSTMNSMPVCQ